MKRFVVIKNIPSPYRLHIFNEMWRQLKMRGIEFHVHFMSRGHVERPKSWMNPKIDFPHTYWRDYGFKTHHFNIGMILHLMINRPDYLWVGSPFDTFTGICAAFFLKAKSKCTWVEGQTKTPGRMIGFIGIFKRLVLSRFPLVAVPGHDAVKYFQMHQKLTSHKMPRIVFMPNLIDETRFKPRDQWPEEEIASIRKSLGCDNLTRICLISARLDEVKGLVPFINQLTPVMVDGWKIVIMGQGALKNMILRAAAERGIADSIQILDYVVYDEMPKYYAAADLFLLSSIHDPNPLSVPEALHSVLPIALSDRCGNVEEGVKDGSNGRVLHVLDEKKFGAELKEILNMPIVDLQKMGRVSKLENAEFWSTVTAIRKFLDDVIA